MTTNFKDWCWLTALCTVLSEVMVYFMIVPEARLTPIHVALLWFFLPWPAALLAFIMGMMHLFRVRRL
jgi:hypothetical protein